MITLKDARALEFYNAGRMMGDKWASERVDRYFAGRSKILKYAGKSRVDRRKLNAYEPFLVGNTYGFWWHYSDNKYLDRVLWLLRRLKVGLRKEAERALVADFILALPFHRQFSFRVDNEFAAMLKDRLGPVGISV